MENDRKLDDLMILNHSWSLATQAVINQESELSLEISRLAEAIADQVVTGELAVKALRQQVVLANQCDRQAVEASNGSLDSLSGEDFSEALARRIAHHSGRQALAMVKTQQRRQTQHIRYYHKKRFGDCVASR